MKTKLEEISKSLDGIRAMVNSLMSECEVAEPREWILKVSFPDGSYKEKVYKTEGAAREAEYFVPETLKTEVFQMQDLDCLARGFEHGKS